MSYEITEEGYECRGFKLGQMTNKGNKIWLDCELIIGKKNTQILYNRFNGMTFDAIGRYYGETAPTIGQRYRTSINKLKKSKLFVKLVECDLAWETV